MNLNLFLKTLKQRRRGLLSYGISLVLYSYFIVALWPTLENARGLKELWESYPEALKAFFGGEGVNIFTFEGYITVEYFSLIWLIIGGAFVISFAIGVTAREIERGTMELLLTQPISRWKIIVTKILVLFLGLVLLIAATMAGIFSAAAVANIGVTYQNFLALSVLALAFLLAIGGYTVFLSSLFDEGEKPAFMSAGLTILFYMINSFAGFSEAFEKIRFLSLFNYYDPYNALISGNIPWQDASVLLGVAIIGFVLSVIIFQRRDISIP